MRYLFIVTFTYINMLNSKYNLVFFKDVIFLFLSVSKNAQNYSHHNLKVADFSPSNA